MPAGEREQVRDAGTRRRTALIAVLATVAALAAFFPGLIFLGESFVCRDSGGTLYPVKAYIAARLRSGELPLWYPYDGLGIPLIGSTIPGLFHPTTLLHLLLPVPDAMRISDLLAFGLACLATWSLARRLGAAQWAGAAAALAYAFSGALVGNVSAEPYLFGGAVYPLFLVGAHELVMGTRVRGLLLAASALALSVLGGDIQSAYLFGLVGLPFVLSLEPRGQGLSAPRRVAWLAGVGLVGLALSAIQLWPSFDAYLATERGAGLGFEHASLWSLHPLRLPELFVGDLIRWTPGATEPNLVRAELIQTVGLWSTTVTVGTTVLLGVVLGLVLHPRRTDWTLLGMSVVLLALAMGAYSPVYRFYFDFVPLGSAFRIPEKMLLHASLPLVLLASRGLTRAAEGHLRRRALIVSSAVAAALVVLAAFGWLASGWSDSQAWELYLRRFGSAAGSSAAVAAVTAVLLLLPVHRPGWAPLRAFGVPIVAFLQLLVWNGRVPAECSAPEWILEAPSVPAATILDHADAPPHTFRVAPLFGTSGSAGAREVELSGAGSLFLWERQALFPDHNAVAGLEGFGSVLPVIPPALSHLERAGPVWRRYPLYNVEYLLGAPGELPGSVDLPLRVVERFPEMDMLVARLSGALPRVYVAGGLSAAGPKEAAALLARPEVVDGSLAVVEQARGVGEAIPVGEARIRSWAPERVVVEVETDRPSVLVLNDAWFPGWRARVGEQDVPIRRANLLVRGVELPPGRHLVTFTYPISAALAGGVFISLLALLVVTGLLLRHRLRGRRGRVSGPSQGAPAVNFPEKSGRSG